MAGKPQSGEVPNGSPIALLVDDDAGVRAMLVEMLVREGFVCLEAETGEEALAIAGESKPVMGIIDLALPGMTGAELAWQLRQKLPNLTIVALSGYLSNWDADDLQDLGFDRMFTKPMDCDAFIEFIRQVRSSAAG